MKTVGSKLNDNEYPDTFKSLFDMEVEHIFALQQRILVAEAIGQGHSAKNLANNLAKSQKRAQRLDKELNSLEGGLDYYQQKAFIRAWLKTYGHLSPYRSWHRHYPDYK